MVSAPVEVSNGTGLYIAAVVMVIIWAWAFQRSGRLSKDDFQ